MRQRIDDVSPEAIARGLARVRAIVASAAATSGRAASDVAIVAAVKYVDAAACAALVEAGVRDLAESRLDQLEAKQHGHGLRDAARWHWIGRLQSRQAAAIAERTVLVHSLCTTSSATRLAGAAAVPGVLVQVNVDRDPAKDGLDPDAVERFLDELPPRLVVSGLMAMPAWTEDAERSRPAFAALRELRDELAPRFAGRHELHALSMGTSQDLRVAVEEGATHVRLGRILYAGRE